MASSGAARPPNLITGALPPLFVGLGDSITANGGNLWTSASSGPSGEIDGRSWHLWAQLRSNSAAMWAGSSATGGHTVNQILTIDLPIVLGMSPRPKYCVVDGGQNDLGSPSGMQADYTSIVTRLMTLGITPILCTLAPSATNLQILEINGFIRRTACKYRLPVVDMYAAVMDHTTGLWLASLSPDSVHPNGLGASVMGTALATVLTQLEPNNIASTWLPQHNVGWAGYGLGTNTNPTLLTDNGATPPIPTDWGILQGSHAAAIAFSTPGGSVVGRRMTMTGNGSGAGALITRLTPPATTVGHRYVAVARVGAAVTGVAGGWQFGIGNGNGPLFDCGRFNGTQLLDDLAPSVLMTTFTQSLAAYFWDFTAIGVNAVVTASEVLVFDLTAAGITT